MKEILYVQAFMQLHDKFEQPGSKGAEKAQPLLCKDSRTPKGKVKKVLNPFNPVLAGQNYLSANLCLWSTPKQPQIAPTAS